MSNIFVTKLTMWIFSNMWFYTLVDIILLILIVVLARKYVKMKKLLEEKVLVSNQNPVDLPKVIEGTTNTQVEAKIEEQQPTSTVDVFDHIIAIQEHEEKEIIHQEVDDLLREKTTFQKYDASPNFNGHQPLSYDSNIPPVDQQIIDSMFGQQEQRNNTVNSVDLNTKPVNFGFDQIDRLHNSSSFSNLNEYDATLSDNQTQHSNIYNESVISGNVDENGNHNIFQPEVNNFDSPVHPYENTVQKNEEDIAEELKTLVEVKRHLIDKIKHYNGIIQQLQFEPDGPEKMFKRREIAKQLKRIKVEFEEYNQIEQEVLQNAKNRVR